MTYSHALLDFDSGFADAEFAEKHYGAFVSTINELQEHLDRPTVARWETKLVTNGFCERRVAAAS